MGVPNVILLFICLLSRLPPYTEMVIPSHALSKVMGKGGTNLENIRKVSLFFSFHSYFCIVSL